ncbi:MAG: polysaccharide deacetylase family protein [Actinomycetota bacterium]
MSARSAAVTFGKRAIKLGLLAPASLARSREPGLLVLGYHRVGARMEREMDLPLAVFEEQMRYLAEHREVVPLAEGVRRLASPLEHDVVAITFDDGYREVYTQAWPVLRDLGLPATVFLATGFVEGTDPAPIRSGAGDRGAPPLPLMWEDVGELHASGFVAIGSHSRSHRSFDTLSRAEAAEECAASRATIERRTGAEVETLAYPGGIVAHEDVVGTHYSIGVGADGAKNVPSSLSATRLSRVPVRASDGTFFFRRRLGGLAPLEDRLYDRLRARSPARDPASQS